MGNICVIGPKSSGKSTYLAALSYFPELQLNTTKKNSFKVMPLGEDARKLAESAENIITTGLVLEETVIGDKINKVDDLLYFSFKIEVKKNPFKKPEEIYLNVRDYPGEVFDEIINPDFNNLIHKEFIDECLVKDVVGCLILFTALEQGADKFYRAVMTRFLELMDVHNRTNNLRLAIAISKCERGEIWPGRIDPETDLFGVHLPKTKQMLRDRLNPKNLRFYATSTFGVLGRNDPRPNRMMLSDSKRQGSILREASSWKPYNLIEPLYWLSRG
jgi:hypothetical protein